ncbi:MAG: beta-ketoacyl synthase chain length factor [Proteobacteria bacterium]|nr:beta-ketoacyl synthase chain length factor [Pseudomonadota bacterium]
MKARLLGAGVWARGLTCYADLVDLIGSDKSLQNADFTTPAPASIPSRERRRAGLMISMAVEVAHQACDHAAVMKAEIPSVFTSAMCDTQITDYMGRKLAGAEKLLSPTRFHNSVHNAASGYWSISAENRASSSYIGASSHSVGAALLDVISLVNDVHEPALLVGYDLATEPPFDDVFAIQETMAFALVFAPLDFRSESDLNVMIELNCLQIRDNPQAQASQAEHTGLKHLAQANPMGSAITLLERVADERLPRCVYISSSAHTMLKIDLALTGA